MTAKQHRYAILFSVAAIVVALDQFTKQMALEYLSQGPVILVEGVLALRLTFNSGGAFGFLPGVPWVFMLAGIAIVAVILLWAGRESPTVVTPLGLVLGGGLGNMADRALRDHGGGVVDFIDLSFWPTFNVADMAIVIGVILVAISGVRNEPAPSET